MFFRMFNRKINLAILTSALFFLGALVVYGQTVPFDECKQDFQNHPELITAQLELKCAAKVAGLPVSEVGPEGFTASLINSAISIVGILALLVILFAGVMWATAGGNEERMEMAKKTLGTAIVGLAIILGAYILARFVISTIKNTTSETVNVGYQDNQTSCASVAGGASCVANVSACTSTGGQVVTGLVLCPEVTPVCCKLAESSTP